MKIKKNKEFKVEESIHLDGVYQDTKSNWEGSEVEVMADEVADEGSGGAVIVRCFDFKFPPGNTVIPTKDQILTPQYLKTLQTLLYFDHDMEFAAEPRVVIQETGFKVFVTCQPRKGARVIDKHGSLITPLTSQEIINGK